MEICANGSMGFRDNSKNATTYYENEDVEKLMPVRGLIKRYDDAIWAFSFLNDMDIESMVRRAIWVEMLVSYINKGLRTYRKNLENGIIIEPFGNDFWKTNNPNRHIIGTILGNLLNENADITLASVGIIHGINNQPVLNIGDFIPIIEKELEEMNDHLRAIEHKLMVVNDDAYGNYYMKLKDDYDDQSIFEEYKIWKLSEGGKILENYIAKQNQVIAEALLEGIMDYDYRAKKIELTSIDLDWIMKDLPELPNGEDYPIDFDKACAKFNRYITRKDDLLLIKYNEYGRYVHRCFNMMNPKQQMAIFELDMMLRFLHEDIKKLKQMNMKDSDLQIEENEKDRRVKYAIDIMNEEGVIEHLYDYTWIMEVMNEIKDTPHFDCPNSFLKYCTGIGIKKLPCLSTLSKEYSKIHGKFPHWTFLKKDEADARRCINVAKRFLKLFRMGM